MLKNDLKKIAERSVQYCEKVIRAQKFVKKKREVYLDRFTVLAENIKGRIF